MTDVAISPRRRREIIDALRRGTVPQQGLDVMAVGLGKFETAIDDELDAVTSAFAGAFFAADRYEPLGDPTNALILPAV